MERVSSYFTFRGRTNRRRYWEIGITIFMLFFLAVLVSSTLSRLPLIGLVGGVLLIATVMATLAATLANGARRLHDRGKSAWWLLLFVVLPLFLSLPGELAKFGADDGFAAAAGLLALLGLPFSLWGFVEMGCLRGQTGPNRFGDDPLAPAAEEAIA